MATASKSRLNHTPQRATSWWYRALNTDGFSAFILLALPVAFLLILKVYPVVYNIYLSFTNYDLFSAPQAAGLDNYRFVFQDSGTRRAILNTFFFTLQAVPLGTALALVIAKILDSRLPGQILFRTLFYLPVISSVVVSAMIWRWIYNPQSGLLNGLLGTLGLPAQAWLSDPRLALSALVVVMIWSSIGANMVIFIAGLQDIPKEVLEAATVDGANALQRFFRITVPLMRPVILFVIVTFTIGTFQNFGLIFLMTQGGPLNTTATLAWEIYMNVFSYLRIGRGAAISVVMLLAVFAITAASFRLLREKQS